MQSLDRPIGLAQATAMVAGIIIGASIFVQPSEINRHVPSVAGVFSVWVAAGILTLFGSLVCAELSSVYPRTGGVYVFLKETLSPACGFLWGWAMFWSAHSGIIAASSVILARYVAFFVPLGDCGIRAIAIGAILLLSFINYLGVRQGSTLQTAVTAGKIAAIVLLLAMVAAFGTPATQSQAAAPAASPFSFREFVLGVSAALFAFGGWHMVTYVAGETRDARRTIPQALMLGCMLVTACYVALNAAYLYLLPLAKVTQSVRVAADAASVMAGSRGAAAISALVILSAVGVLNGVILAGPRTYFAMAQEGLAFRWLAEIHPRFHTPHRTILIQAIWSCALVATGTYRALFTRVVYTEWLFFALMAYGMMRLHARPDYAPPFRAWGYPAVPVVFAVAAVVVAVIQILADPVQAGTGLLFVVLGLPVYYFWMRSHAHH
ncbi:MAG TPA: amino acid permease [Candidatus Sulfopaludibacter sp.]|nr:amino acid permease [Candidatus Sulfopaludibacter sp.]